MSELRANEKGDQRPEGDKFRKQECGVVGKFRGGTKGSQEVEDFPVKFPLPGHRESRLGLSRVLRKF